MIKIATFPYQPVEFSIYNPKAGELNGTDESSYELTVILTGKAEPSRSITYDQSGNKITTNMIVYFDGVGQNITLRSQVQLGNDRYTVQQINEFNEPRLFVYTKIVLSLLEQKNGGR